ncbi:MAG: hypothetical protein IJR89_09130 [Clostridia bacterium]|nr:hypothetical protein [Clostridia bacterium]
MTINELQNKYYFHDSLLDEVIIDKQHATVSLRIDFCFWAQNGYKDEDPETGMIVLSFTGVKKYPEIEGELDSYSILKTSCLQDDTWLMVTLDDETDTCYELSISADKVTVIVEDSGND